MKFGLQYFKSYAKKNGIILAQCKAIRCDVPAAFGGDGSWQFTVDGIDVHIGYTVYYGIETLFNTCHKPMPYNVFKVLEEYINYLDETKNRGYGWTDNKNNYYIKER